MTKKKRRLTAAEKAEKARRKAEFVWIFINGRQKRVRRPPMIDGMDSDAFLQANADPCWLHANERWDLIPVQATDDVNATDGDDLPY